MREIYSIVIFFILYGLLNPSFEEFTYYFLLNEIKISKFIFSLLALLGQICHIIGALIYKAWCRNVDYRIMILCAMIVASLGAFLSYTFAMRWNLAIGIPDMAFLFFTDIVFSTINTILFSLPLLALFAKITPARIEGTTFAFLTGTLNFAKSVISPNWGSFINHQFVGVNKKDLSNYSTLLLIALIGSLITFVLLPLIPTKKQLKEFREKRDEELEEKRKERRLRRNGKNE